MTSPEHKELADKVIAAMKAAGKWIPRDEPMIRGLTDEHLQAIIDAHDVSPDNPRMVW
jgi:hypothetical protein